MPATTHTDHLEELITTLTTNQTTLAQTQASMTTKIDEILVKLAAIETSENHPSVSSAPPPLPTPSPDLRHHQRMKLDVPIFDGSDAMGWIFKISQFFEFHDTPEADRLTIASFYMEGPALGWYQWMARNGQLTYWHGLLNAIEALFASSQYEDHKGSLFKLTQKGSVSEYLSAFETLANWIVGLQPPFLLSCFISGLIPEILREVLALQPLNLIQAASLARLQEEKFNDARRALRNRGILNPTSLQQIPPSSTSKTPLALLPPPPKPSPPTFKRLSPTEMAQRREKGLCFNCDEKFRPGHKCSSRFFILITDDDIDPDLTHIDPNSAAQPDPKPDLEPSQAQISFHALSGHLAPETLRLAGRITHQRVHILMDGGRTHNFLQERLVMSLGLKVQPTVMVGNGTLLDCNQVCPGVTLHIQGHTFVVDLHILPISGADLVLGVQWMKYLGPILVDYNALTMQFKHAGSIIHLQGECDVGLHMISAHQVERLIHTDSISSFFHVQMLPVELPSNQKEPSPITELLQQFDHLFTPLASLPPPRQIDHSIHLLPHSV
ncbi:uncharacterized protein LOC123905356 [Trifolium pratense]|uniref:Uncharacterized protein n=1 Tax=Trifolium pratense TaxID=57577 RepID=A0ACB0LGR8_TRIPR|nr:uncharacterized protein LOC123905356 [Trifolium pratense]CAJ2668471.1 unnamed protein product [Trifolium pratense]